jgi:hypothetical protein
MDGNMVLPLAYAICNVSVMPLRTEPGHRAEQCSQLLFGERAEIIEVNSNDWAYIQCAWDGYRGWCKISQMALVPKKEYIKEVKYLAASNNDKLVFSESKMWLPLGCDLRMKSVIKMSEKDAGVFKGKKSAIKELELNCENLKNAAYRFLHAPYQWGGRSIAGIDCSGLMQMAFKLCNHTLPRDADQQANEGQLVDFLPNAQCGDLAFFDNKEGKIIHVGLLLDNQTIIHATDAAGRVVVDKIDQGGIISVSLRKRTHNLRLVRRIEMLKG